MKEGLVSVIIPTFGRSQFLKRCVESVSSQTYDNIEIIIVDDNGKGQLQQLETATVVDSIKCRFPLHYLIQDENRGGSAARNAGAKHAQGEFIAFLDDDDQFEEDRILKQIHFLKEKAYQNPQIKACTCLVKRRKRGNEVDRQDPKHKENYLFELLALKESLYTGSTLLVFAQTFFELDGFDERFKRNQDLEFMIRFFQHHQVAVLNEHLTILNIDDRTNIPSYQNILTTKQLFLQKFKPIISRLPVEQQREIYTNNALQTAKVALWNRNVIGFVKAIRSAELSLHEWAVFVKDVLKKSIMHLK